MTRLCIKQIKKAAARQYAKSALVNKGDEAGLNLYTSAAFFIVIAMVLIFCYQ